jgi:hypothetical protein
MVFIGLLLTSDPLLPGPGFFSIAGAIALCDAQEKDLIYRKYNPD